MVFFSIEEEDAIKMFNTALGVKIPFPDKIEEKYSLSENRIVLNISFEKLEPLIEEFLIDLSEPLFLFIHRPLKENEEKELRKNDFDSFHSEILYLDGQTKKQIIEIMSQFGEVLLNDGISSFGIASHETEDEIFVQKYKIVGIYSKDIEKYTQLMDKYGIGKTEKLLTAWDTFSQEHPSRCSRVVIDNKDIDDVVKALKEKGMYPAEIIEE